MEILLVSFFLVSLVGQKMVVLSRKKKLCYLQYFDQYPLILDHPQLYSTNGLEMTVLQRRKHGKMESKLAEYLYIFGLLRRAIFGLFDAYIHENMSIYEA